MSLAEDGKLIRCDGEACDAVAMAPIALRSQLSLPEGVGQVTGWLFVATKSGCLHYCPHCARLHLLSLSSQETKTAKE